MGQQELTDFFMWCTILDGGLLFLATVMLGLFPEWACRTQNRWAPISREAYNVMIYGFLGGLKLLVIVFNLTPFLVLRYILH